MNFIKQSLLIIIIYIFLNAFFLMPVFAQTTNQDILISWEAKNLVPFWFKGKILPSAGSIINIAFEYIKNNKIVDISKQKVYWYIDGNLIQSGIGIKKINIVAPKEKFDLRVELPDLNVLKTIEIPVAEPMVIVDAPFPKKTITSNYFEVRALPYFFNIENNDWDYFDVLWQINDKNAIPSQEDRFKLKIETDNNVSNINIKAFLLNTLNTFEAARGEVNIFKK
jgi:hypothetical protein